ncbi:MAG: Uncharacterized protein FD147_1496 [Chloroflexi bacterium]|nr:MAG: Uncharacterized protein FD147_1496 [Chloroflexota bacterium]
MIPYDFTGLIGQIERYNPFPSTLVPPRIVDVWLPPGYTDSSERYSVLYMSDGQNLFNPELSKLSHFAWVMDETVNRLIEEGKIKKIIVVGIWSTKDRVREYIPQKAVSGIKKIVLDLHLHGSPNSDRYLRFMVEELKPFIDSNYHTKKNANDTFIMGSSMGGLISLYALCEYPEVFGGAGCVSTHFPIGKGAMLDYMKAKLPDPAHHRIYFDFGTGSLDAAYEPYQQMADEIMQAKGYIQGIDWLTKKFEGHDHSEKYWRERVHFPLEFLLG